MCSSAEQKYTDKCEENAEKLMFDHFGFEKHSSTSNVDDIKFNYLGLVAYRGKKGNLLDVWVVSLLKGTWNNS